MYFDKDSFSTAEKVDFCPTGEARSTLEFVDCSVSQYEIHRQLCREGNDIRNEYFLGICRKVVTSIKMLFQISDQEKVQSQEYHELQKMWLKKMEDSAPRHMKGWIRTGGWI